MSGAASATSPEVTAPGLATPATGRRSLPPVPALVVGRVHHARHTPLRHTFTHHHHQWLIDIDDPPRLPRWLSPLTQFRGRDHLAGDTGMPQLRDSVLRIARREGVDTEAVHRILLLTNPRVLGHVFNPLSAYWCLDRDDRLVALVIEVHNTYGQRHAYVLAGDDTASVDAPIDKEFYVSPFNDVSGGYRVRARLSASRVSVAVSLTRDGQQVLSTAVWGTPRPATTAAVGRLALRHPLMPLRTTALIRLHGIWLWARRLPVQPRPAHDGRSLR